MTWDADGFALYTINYSRGQALSGLHVQAFIQNAVVCITVIAWSLQSHLGCCVQQAGC